MGFEANTCIWVSQEQFKRKVYLIFFFFQNSKFALLVYQEIGIEVIYIDI